MWFVLLLLAAVPVLSSPLPQADEGIRQEYEAGEQALRNGQFAAARKAFLSVLQTYPEDVGARVNLGVVYMREKNWDEALKYLREAEHRAPGIPGIRLNIGLAEYRKGDYAAAIPEFESVVRDQPESTQARRLLGLCYLFVERYKDAAAALEPLWPSANNDLTYLYSLAVAAGNTGQQAVEDRAVARLMEIGKDSPVLHLLRGKAYLAHEQFDLALQEFQAAAQQDPRLPLVHYNLGVVLRRQGHLDEARAQFLQDAAIEPDVALDYDQLGVVAYESQENSAAEANFRKAVNLDARLGTSWFGLAKVLKRENRFPEALKAIHQALQIDSESASAHYLRAQILIAMGDRDKAETDLAAVRRLKAASRDKLEQQFERAKYQDPAIATATNE